MSGNFVHCRITLSGDERQIRSLAAKYVSGSDFKIGALIPVPPPLDLELNNIVETGYNALYGDWRKVAQQWMLKDCADQLGYEFPLTSRSQVVECLKRVDSQGAYLRSGERFQDNLAKFGHGARDSWQEEKWGTSGQIDGVRVTNNTDALIVRLVSTSFPRGIVEELSREFPSLGVEVACVDDRKRIAKRSSFKAGRLVRTEKAKPAEVLKELGIGA